MKSAKVIYTDTTSAEARERYLNRYRRAEKQREYKQRRWYFFKQRMAGVAMLMLTMLTVIMLDGDATIGVFTVPLALYLIFGSEMVIVNGYFWETKERR